MQNIIFYVFKSKNINFKTLFFFCKNNKTAVINKKKIKIMFFSSIEFTINCSSSVFLLSFL